MKDRSHRSYSWTIAWVLLLCALAWGILLLTCGRHTKGSHSAASSGVPSKRASNTPPKEMQLAGDMSEDLSRQIVSIPSTGGLSGTVRLKRDESAVLSYSELAPGMVRALIITPELQPDGKIKLTTRLLHMTEEEASREDIKEIFPDTFEIQRQGALNKERLNDFLGSTTNDKNAQLSEMPSMVTKPGEGTGFAMSGTNEDGTPFNDGQALMLSMTPQPLEDSGGFDLKYDLQHLKPQPDGGFHNIRNLSRP